MPRHNNPAISGSMVMFLWSAQYYCLNPDGLNRAFLITSMVRIRKDWGW